MASIDLCELCNQEPAPGQGEHIWPRWYLRDLDAQGPPAAGWSLAGEPITNKAGMQIHHPTRQRVFLHVCRSCNEELNRRFELPAREIIRRLRDSGWQGPATAEEWRTIGLWFAKVLVLLGDPQARYTDDRINAKTVRFPNGTPDRSWLINGAQPPTDLSLWVFRASLADEDIQYRMPTPWTVHTADGTSVDFHLLTWAVDGLCVTLLSHPGWSVRHPLVQRGDAWELLRGAPASGDLSSLPQLSYAAVQWIAVEPTLKPEHRLGNGLPPLRAIEDSLLFSEVMDVFTQCEFSQPVEAP